MHERWEDYRGASSAAGIELVSAEVGAAAAVTEIFAAMKASNRAKVQANAPGWTRDDLLNKV